MITVLTVIGWILLGIVLLVVGLLLLIALLLSVPVTLRLHYGDETRLRVWYGIIPINTLPAKPKKEKSKEQLQKEAEKKQKKADKKQQKADKKAEKEKDKPAKPKKPLKTLLAEFGIPDYIPETMGELLKALVQVGKMTNGLRRSLVIKHLKVEIVCGGADAAQAAINYGRAWPLLLGIEQVLGKILRLRKFEGQPVLDYTADRQQFRGEASIGLLPIRMVAVVIHRALRAFGSYRRVRKANKKRIKSKQKGVTTHE